jgi:hypothetical protein
LDSDAEDRRSRAIIAFLGAGMHDRPSPALCVRALAEARRSVAVDRLALLDELLAVLKYSPGIEA